MHTSTTQKTLREVVYTMRQALIDNFTISGLIAKWELEKINKKK
jgi:hypothetical protein